MGAEHPGAGREHAARRDALSSFHDQGGAERSAEAAGRRWFICSF